MSHGPRLAVGLPVLMVAGALVLAGCGDDDDDSAEPAKAPETAQAPPKPPTVDDAQLESQLKKTLSVLQLPALPTMIYPRGGGPPEQSQIGGGRIKVRSVTCPPSVPLEKGRKFDCDVVVRKATASVTLKQLNAKGTSMSYTATVESEVTEGIPVTTKLRGRLKLK